MTDQYRITNWITGEEMTPAPEKQPDAYLEGLEAGLNEPYKSNPYPPGTQEHHDWEEGWTDAEGN